MLGNNTENAEENSQTGEKPGVIKLSEFNMDIKKNLANDQEKKKLRQMRFDKNVAEVANTFETKEILEVELKKREDREKRFGNIKGASEDEKIKKRAERFNTGILQKIDPEEEKLKQIERAKKFGLVNKDAEEQKRSMRKMKFQMENPLEKKVKI